ncbi:EF-TU receptor [Actinidia rufa]|uniref:non-specific serine/threonine protein kinase n=1 Tax=Actinidia rufa TaxID=165716 RepID=A0A7J0DQU2_9ERIC|nr:EF-TU receptor [Actinidia rufa]
MELVHLSKLHELEPSLRPRNLNSLSGSIPMSVSNATKIYHPSLSYNKFTGKVPPLERLSDLEVVAIARDHLVTREADGDDLNFLYSLTNASNLNILQLEENNFGGVLPESISNFSTSLFALYLQKNNIVGAIPTGVGNLVNLEIINLSGNQFTGSILSDIGKLQNLKKLLLSDNKFYRDIPSSFGNLTFLLTLRLYQNNFHGSIPVSLRKCKMLVQLSLHENNLTVGSVYKGTVDQGRIVVAVKVLNLQFHGASKSFIAECKVLKGIKHRNIVKVLTTCSSIDYHDYVHHFGPKPIVHCDLKPNNIHLDHEMTAHVGNFGLATFLLEATSDSYSNQSSSVGAKGSIGYATPEYGMGCEVSTSGDVYSNGILLLEMFTGKRPTDPMFSDSLSLHNFAKMAFPEQVASIANSTLFQQQDNGLNQSSASSHKIKECLTSIFKAGLACSEELPRNRLAINEVLTQLHAIKNTLLGSTRRAA